MLNQTTYGTLDSPKYDRYDDVYDQPANGTVTMLDSHNSPSTSTANTQDSSQDTT